MTPSEISAKANGQSLDFKAKAQDAEGQLEHLTHTAGEKFGEIAADFAATSSEYVKTTREYIRENPGKVIAGAAIAGVFAGSLLTLAMRRSRN